MSHRVYEPPKDLVTIREAVDWLNAEAERTGSAARYTDTDLRNWTGLGVKDALAAMLPDGGRLKRTLPTYRIPPNIHRVMVSQAEVLNFVAKTGRALIRRAERKARNGRPENISFKVDPDDVVSRSLVSLQGELKAKGIELSLAGVVRLLISEALRARGALK